MKITSMWIGLVASTAAAACAASPAPLRLEAKIPLGAVRGRIDHLAIDLGRQRLFVAELGNDSLGVVDLRQGRVVRTLRGLREPQGIGYVPSTDTVYVANAGDGSVRLFQGTKLTPVGDIALGDDADNVRVDEAAHRLFVGYGTGGLAIIDTTAGTKIADVLLRAHPESFQLDPSGIRIFINIPDAGVIAVANRMTDRVVARWTTGSLRANFPLVFDAVHQRLLAVFRRPPRLGVYRAGDGHLLDAFSTCRDADDLFLDAKRRRLYVICAEGVIDVMTERGMGYTDLGRIRTSLGARTGLFVPQLDELFVAVRATHATPAAIWVYRPL